jgi:cobyrinic acid a,c-diamide synthase
MVRAIVIAGTSSSVGKTTVCVGLIAALRRRGLTVQPFKVGPDYIDPTYHEVAAERTCRNLDAWMVPAQKIPALFAKAACDADVAVVEGVMGLFDGLGYDDDTASTAHIARLLGAPVIVVVDAGKTARNAAALAYGMSRFDRETPVAGFVVNRAASDSHGLGVASAIERATSLPVLGYLRRDSALHVAERHLGLVPTREPGRWTEFVESCHAAVVRQMDLDRVCALMKRLPDISLPVTAKHQHDVGPTIAVARDEAFSFCYAENLELLREAGADLAFFSPLHDEDLPRSTAGILLSGGFPELYARELSENSSLLFAVRAAHARGVPIYAECGGLMYLTDAIIDLDGREHAMVGLLPGQSVMTGQRTLGYRLAQAVDTSWLLHEGETVHGHEFHYSKWQNRPRDLPPAFLLRSPTRSIEPGAEGARLNNLWASYVHLHFWDKPELAARFVAACRISATGRKARV